MISVQPLFGLFLSYWTYVSYRSSIAHIVSVGCLPVIFGIVVLVKHAHVLSRSTRYSYKTLVPTYYVLYDFIVLFDFLCIAPWWLPLHAFRYLIVREWQSDLDLYIGIFIILALITLENIYILHFITDPPLWLSIYQIQGSYIIHILTCYNVSIHY